MLGYDWPRLHAALNDLPAALLLVAVLFDLAGRSRAGPRSGRRASGRWSSGAVGGGARRRLGPPGRGAHRPRRGGAPGHGDPRGARPDHPGRLRGAGAVADRAGAPDGKHRAGRGARGLARRLGGTARDGGVRRQAGVRPRRRHPDAVSQAEMHERAEGHHHHGGEGEEAERARRPITTMRRRPRPPIRRRPVRRDVRRSGQPAGHTARARHAAAQGLTGCASRGRWWESPP